MGEDGLNLTFKKTPTRVRKLSQCTAINYKSSPACFCGINNNYLIRFKLDKDYDISKFALNHFRQIAMEKYRELRNLLGWFLPYFP